MPLVAGPFSSMAIEKGTGTDTTPGQCGHGYPRSNALAERKSRQQHGLKRLQKSMLENSSRNENAIRSYRIYFHGSTAVYIRLNSMESSRKTGIWYSKGRRVVKLPVPRAEFNVRSFHTFVREWKRCTSATTLRSEGYADGLRSQESRRLEGRPQGFFAVLAMKIIGLNRPQK
jgi:hypothetical protein